MEWKARVEAQMAQTLRGVGRGSWWRVPVAGRPPRLGGPEGRIASIWEALLACYTPLVAGRMVADPQASLAEIDIILL